MNIAEVQADYNEQTRILGELLGWKDIEFGGKLGNYNVPAGWAHGVLGDGERALLPAWIRIGGDAYSLMVEHACYPFESGGCIIASSYGYDNKFVTDPNDHITKEMAVSYAIVCAVIRKLQPA